MSEKYSQIRWMARMPLCQITRMQIKLWNYEIRYGKRWNRSSREALEESSFFATRLSKFSVSITCDVKGEHARGAAMAVAMDLRPLSFTDKKREMGMFVNAVFKAGQEMPVNENVQSESILRSATCVTKALKKIAVETREEYRELILQKMYETGGGVTTDGVTLKVQDRQFQDLSLHFIEVQRCTRIDIEPKVELKVATLLLKKKPEVGDAASIRSMLGTYLSMHYGKGIDWLTKRFTMVTDCASVMARVALSSVSSNVAPMDEKWMGCFAHQLNTAMKCCMASLSENECPELKRISEDLQRVKKIVRIFKQSGWNGSLPNGYHLIQECETRFGTTLDVAQRFLKSMDKTKEIIELKNSNSAKEAFSHLLKESTMRGRFRMPAIEAILDAFQVVVYTQTKIQAACTPTAHLALPLFYRCKKEIERIADGGSVWRDDDNDFVPSTSYSRRLCRCLLEWLEAKVRVHDLWLVGCFFHPFFREFQFVSSLSRGQEYKSRAEAMLRALIANYTDSQGVQGTVRTHVPATDAAQSGHSGFGNSTPCEATVVGRKRTFSLMEFADSHFQQSTSVDEVSRYNALDVTMLGLDRGKFLKDDFAAIKFWYKRKGTFPYMYKAVCRVYATPVSSCASERVFSALNRVSSRDRASIGAETLEYIMVVRSMLS